MPGIDSLIREIKVKIQTFEETANRLLLSKNKARILSVKLVYLHFTQSNIPQNTPVLKETRVKGC